MSTLPLSNIGWRLESIGQTSGWDWRMDTPSHLMYDWSEGWAKPTGALSFSNYLQPEKAGNLQLSAFNLAKRYQIDRAEARNLQAEQFGRESDVFNVRMAEQAKASGTFFERLGQLDTRLQDIASGFPTAASKVSTVREYSQYSQRAMQNTARYLQELETLKTPEAPTVGFGFRDPLTGKELNLNAQFEDVYSGDFDPKAVAAEQVRSEFKTLKDQYYQEARAFYDEFYGDPSDYNIGEKFRNRKDWSARLDVAKDKDRRSTLFAEAAALAQMGGFEETFSVTEPGKFGKTYTYDPANMFWGADVNKTLKDMISKATDRLEIDRLLDKESVQAEFERRKATASSQYTLYKNQQARIAQQAEYLEEEKQRARQELQRQKAEYSQTLSSFGPDSPDAGAKITFTDTRPQ